MTSPDLTPPAPTWAVDDEDVARVERWAARRRAELSRLSLALRSAQLKAEQAERAAVAVLERPDAVLAVVESLLDEATADAQSGLEAARREATSVVAGEYERASSVLRDLGLDPEGSLGAAGWEPDLVLDLVRPDAAESLWRPLDVESSVPTAGREEAPPPCQEEVSCIAPAPATPSSEVVEAGREFEHLDVEGHASTEDPGAWFVAEGGMGSDEGGIDREDRAWRHPVRSGRPRGRRASAALVHSAPPAPAEPGPPELGWPDDDPSLPVSAFPSRWPDAAQAARDFPEAPGLDLAPESVPAVVDAADGPDAPDRFDDFMRGPGTFDVFWGDVEDRQPLRDRLRRRTAEDLR